MYLLVVYRRQHITLLRTALLLKMTFAQLRLIFHIRSGRLDAHSHGGIPPLENGLVAVVHAQSLLKQQIGNEIGLILFQITLSSCGR